jgi:hypothetical protein
MKNTHSGHTIPELGVHIVALSLANPGTGTAPPLDLEVFRDAAKGRIDVRSVAGTVVAIQG